MYTVLNNTFSWAAHCLTVEQRRKFDDKVES